MFDHHPPPPNKRVSQDLQKTALGIVRVVKSIQDMGMKSSERPKSKAWEEVNDGKCVDLDPNSLTPLIPVRVPQKVAGSGSFTNSFGFLNIATGKQVPPDPTPTSTTSSSDSRSANAKNLKRRQVNVNMDKTPPPLGKASNPPNITYNVGPPPTPAGAQAAFFVNNVTWQCKWLSIVYTILHVTQKMQQGNDIVLNGDIT